MNIPDEAARDYTARVQVLGDEGARIYHFPACEWIHAEYLRYTSRNGTGRCKVVTRMEPMHLAAYAQYRKPLIHKGGK